MKFWKNARYGREIILRCVSARSAPTSSAKNSDKIIVLEDGQIMQQGTHNELVNSEGYYKELYAKQLSEKEM